MGLRVKSTWLAASLALAGLIIGLVLALGAQDSAFGRIGRCGLKHRSVEPTQFQKRQLLERRWAPPVVDGHHVLKVCKNHRTKDWTPADLPGSVDSPPVTGNASPNGGPSGPWDLRFRDEFNGNSLDRSKWRPNWFGSGDGSITNPVNGSAQNCVDPDLARVVGGELQLSVEPRGNCRGYSYAGSAVSSNPRAGGNFQFTHGYIEFRAILPGQDGIWPALWTNGQNWPADGEIDVMESGMPRAENPQWHYHYSGGGPGGGIDLPGSSRSWHTYAAHWEPGRIRWYYDGKLVGTHTDGVVNSPHYVMMELSVWPSGSPSRRVTTRVDYVRVWQR
jgi:hypothetical protein